MSFILRSIPRTARASLACAAALVTCASAARAQEIGAGLVLRGDSAAVTVLPAGTWVRVTQSTLRPRRLVGSLGDADSTTVSVLRRGSGQSVTLPYAAVENVEVSLSPRSTSERAIHGAGTGMLVGLATTAVLFAFGAAVDSGTQSCGDCILTGKTAALAAGIPLTIVTTGIGALLGAGSRGEHWATVRTPIRTVARDSSAAARP